MATGLSWPGTVLSSAGLWTLTDAAGSSAWWVEGLWGCGRKSSSAAPVISFFFTFLEISPPICPHQPDMRRSMSVLMIEIQWRDEHVLAWINAVTLNIRPHCDRVSIFVRASDGGGITSKSVFLGYAWGNSFTIWEICWVSFFIRVRWEDKYQLHVCALNKQDIAEIRPSWQGLKMHFNSS